MTPRDALHKKTQTGDALIGIIALGQVGLPLAHNFDAAARFDTRSVDASPPTSALTRGRRGRDNPLPFSASSEVLNV